MFEAIRNYASARNLRIALAVFLFALIAINIAATRFYESTGGYGILDLGGGANLFDDRGGYTPDQAYALIAHYGGAGIHHYYLLLIADIFFPASLGLFALLAIVRASQGAPASSRLLALAAIPFLYTLADWLENVGIVTMLLNYPLELPALATVTNIVRGIKGALASTSLLLVGVMWSLVFIRSFRKEAA